MKDSGARQSFDSGMVRDTTEGKVNFLNVRFGPMLRRWADHLTKGRVKYPDASPGTPNWTLASGIEEYLRAKESAARHFEAWLAGERDEDHASGVFFNINLAEYVLEKTPELDPSMGAAVVAAQSPTTKTMKALLDGTILNSRVFDTRCVLCKAGVVKAHTHTYAPCSGSTGCDSTCAKASGHCHTGLSNPDLHRPTQVWLS